MFFGRSGVYVWEQLQKEPAKAFDPATFKPCANAMRKAGDVL